MVNMILLAVCISLPLASPEASPAALASPDAYASAYGYSASPLPVLVGEPLAPSSQYHAQDDIGQYNYGFSSQDQTKSEIRTADGVTRGAYSYVDANGIVQSVQYISDAMGFRVAATNLPVHDVDVPVAEGVAVAHHAAPVAPLVAAAPVHQAPIAPSVDYAYLPYAQGYNYHVQPTQYVVPTYANTPVVQAAPLVQAAPILTGSQYHSQDDVGQYSFGYNDPNSVKQEVKTADGVVRGAYRYVDTNGVLQTVEYIADAAGFRVAASNLPQGTVTLPVNVVDTPEVAAAKVAHARAYAEAHAAAAVQPEAPIVYSPVTYSHQQPHVYPAAGLPVNVVDTPEVAAAKVAHAHAYAEAHAAAAIQPEVTAHAAFPVTFPAEALAAVEAPMQQTVQQVEYSVAPAVHTPVVAGEGSQYHAQDDFGQYSYGYSDPNSVKQEVKTADGVTRGGYSYVDANGLVQTVNYIADALGFRVAATNLPVHVVDTPVAVAAHVAAPVAAHVAAPVAAHVAAPVAAPVVAAAPLPVSAAYTTPHVMSPQVSYSYLPYAANYGYSALQTAPVIAAGAPAPAVDGANSQFHAQDDLGQYNYGFSHPTQTKQEVRTADGVTRGGYSYIDANGLVQTVNYIADALGFRVAATNLPVSPSPAGEVPVSAPGVTAAYHHAAPEVLAPQVQYSYLPYAQDYGYHAAPAPVVSAVKAAPSRPSASITPAYYGAAHPTVYASAPAAQPIVYTSAAPVVAQSAQLVHSAPAAQPAVYAAAPVAEGSQYHAQDDFGQYSFGYSDGQSVKQEVKTADGVVRGAYSYIDSDGIVQSVNYIADALGFRVGATNLPVHHVDGPVAVEAAPVAAVAPVAVAQAAHPVAPVAQQAVIAPQVPYSYLPYASNYGYSLPVEPTVVANTVPLAAPVSPNSQFHAQDDLGQYNYGYSDPNSVKQEVKTADGVTRGSYSYVDANGLVQTVNYISDVAGFRVAATNLPVHAVDAVHGGVEEAIVTPQVAYSYLPYAQDYGYSLPAAGAA